MTTYLVTVIVGDGLTYRYFDSIWVQKGHAEKRAKELREELRRAGIPTECDGNPIQPRWAVRLTEATAADGQIANEGGVQP